jgi:hypothetical protein
MNPTRATVIRICVLAVSLAVTAACSSEKQPAPGTVDHTIVGTMPDTANDAGTAAPVLSDQHVTISKTVWANYQDYLTKVGRIGDGYFFVTEDGLGAGSWACGNALCEGSFDGQGAARKQCEASSPGKTCLLFAKDSRIQMNYEVAP